MNNIYVGFDFSINKPAATVYCNGAFNFLFWPLNITEDRIDNYNAAGVSVHNRDLEPIHKNMASSDLVLTHTVRSIGLANMIIDDLDKLIQQLGVGDNYRVYIASEGLSFASRGDATLNLATYKGVLLAKIYEHFAGRLEKLVTYSPITIKLTAGVLRKSEIKSKQPMIDSFMDSTDIIPFKYALMGQSLKNKTRFYEGVDDIVDSYWALKTMVQKEKLTL